MTKWPVQKQTHRTTQKHVEYQDATYIQKTILILCVCGFRKINSQLQIVILKNIFVVVNKLHITHFIPPS